MILPNAPNARRGNYNLKTLVTVVTSALQRSRSPSPRGVHEDRSHKLHSQLTAVRLGWVWSLSCNLVSAKMSNSQNI